MYRALALVDALVLISSPLGAGVQSPSRQGPTPLDRANWINAYDYRPDPALGSAVWLVGFSLTVDAQGTPTGCSIVKSSGRNNLDELTCRVLLRKAHFLPANDSAGSAVPSTFVSVIRYEGITDLGFDLSSPPEAASKYEQGITNVRVTFGVRGAAPVCEITNSSGFGDLDDAACATFKKMDLSKMPIRKAVAVEISWKLPTKPPVQAH